MLEFVVLALKDDVLSVVRGPVDNRGDPLVVDQHHSPPGKVHVCHYGQRPPIAARVDHFEGEARVAGGFLDGRYAPNVCDSKAQACR